jgi:hypothetical protein
MGERTHASKIFVGIPVGKRPFGSPRRRQKYNIKMYLRDIEWECVDWFHLAQDREQ